MQPNSAARLILEDLVARLELAGEVVLTGTLLDAFVEKGGSAGEFRAGLDYGEGQGWFTRTGTAIKLEQPGRAAKREQ